MKTSQWKGLYSQHILITKPPSVGSVIYCNYPVFITVLASQRLSTWHVQTAFLRWGGARNLDVSLSISTLPASPPFSPTRP